MITLSPRDVARASQLDAEILAFPPCPEMRELLLQTQKGELQAYLLFCEHITEPVFNYAFIRSNDRLTANGVTEITFQRAMANIMDFSESMSAEAWIMSIARQVTSEKLGGRFCIKLSAFETKFHHSMHMVAALTPLQQECVILRAGFGFDNSVVAGIMGLTPNQITALYYDASQAIYRSQQQS